MEFVPFGSKDTIRMSIAIVRRLIAVPTTTGKMPTDDDCTRFLMMCSARRLNPFEQDAFLIGYDTKNGPKFSMITAHQAFLKRAELNQEYDGMESGVIVIDHEKLVDREGDFMLPDDILVGAWAKVYFKNRSHPMSKRVNLKTFNTGRSQWLANPAGMIVKCAEADALRSSFPTMLGGLYVQEELTPEPPKVTEPIFKSDSKVSAETIEVVDMQKVNLEHVQALCQKDSVPEAVLVEFMQSTGLLEAEKGIETATEAELQSVIDNWDAYSAKIKEVAP